MIGSCSTHDDFGELGFHLCQKCLAEDFCQEFTDFYFGCETSVKALRMCLAPVGTEEEEQDVHTRSGLALIKDYTRTVC